jgi:predicted DNA-binding protein with PD1-like motif
MANNNFKLRLNCWVLGSDVNQIFTVRVEPSNNVSELEAAMTEENKNSFASIYANGLVLRKVSIPADGDFVDKANKPEACQDSEPLDAMTELGQIFTGELPRKHLHVVVQVLPRGMFEFFAMSFVN